MKPSLHIAVSLLLFLMMGAGCNSTSITKCGVCPGIAQIPNLKFNVVDKTTKQDLFWGGQYKVSQLNVKHIINGVAYSGILRVDSVTKVFIVLLEPDHAVDTVTMQVADKPLDILLFKTGTAAGCCPFLQLNSVTYNGALVYTHQSGPQVVVLSK